MSSTLPSVHRSHSTPYDFLWFIDTWLQKPNSIVSPLAIDHEDSRSTHGLIRTGQPRHDLKDHGDKNTISSEKNRRMKRESRSNENSQEGNRKRFFYMAWQWHDWIENQSSIALSPPVLSLDQLALQHEEAFSLIRDNGDSGAPTWPTLKESYTFSICFPLCRCQHVHTQ